MILRVKEPDCKECDVWNNMGHFLIECTQHQEKRSELNQYMQVTNQTMTVENVLTPGNSMVSRLMSQYFTRTKVTI
jgi:hypothetical protein